jgi:membrane protein DedA with SNARE-associated domain/membrane-associated phospholipid phosphatase
VHYDMSDMMIEEHIRSFIHFLQAHPHWSGLITFFVAFLESLAVVGTIIPGSVTMTAIGMLIGTSTFPLGITLLWAVTGAFSGDLLSYWLGLYYQDRLRNMWPFKNHPNWIEVGESFFHKHGGKSILIGRFIGPFRSIIPMIAGLLQMPLRRFILATIPTACLFVMAYMFPGILLGALSLQLPPKVATKFILILLGSIVCLLLIAWLISIFSGKLRKMTDYVLTKSWYKLRSLHYFDWFTHSIANKDHPEDARQLGLLILSGISFLLFLVVAMNVFEQGILTSFNHPTFEFLRSIRNPKTDLVMIGITLLGDVRVLALSMIFISIWLFLSKNFRLAFHWLAALAIGLLLSNVLKYFFFFPRPTGLLHASSTSSFPSGHTLLSMMFYGFFATCSTMHIEKRYRQYAYYIALSVILLVGFSRLYLGAHWLTDVIASLFLGYAFLACVILSYRRKALPTKMLYFSSVVVFITCVTWVCYFELTYQRSLHHYSLNWPLQTIDENSWWGKLNSVLPTYRQNRIGNPQEPMNIQLSGDIEKLKRGLIIQGWTATPNMTILNNTIQKFSSNNIGSSILPALYLNKGPVLFMVKDDPKAKLILKLWHSNVYLSESWNELYIGNIVEYRIHRHKHKMTCSYDVIKKIIPYIYPEWKTRVLVATKIPPTLFQQKWNAEILQISSYPSVSLIDAQLQDDLEFLRP